MSGGEASSTDEAAAALSSSTAVLLVDLSRAVSDLCGLALLTGIQLSVQKVPSWQGAEHQDGTVSARVIISGVQCQAHSCRQSVRAKWAHQGSKRTAVTQEV